MPGNNPAVTDDKTINQVPLPIQLWRGRRVLATIAILLPITALLGWFWGRYSRADGGSGGGAAVTLRNPPVALAATAGGGTQRRWVAVTALTGMGNKRGAPFALGGAPARLRYALVRHVLDPSALPAGTPARRLAQNAAGSDAAPVLIVYVLGGEETLENTSAPSEVLTDQPGIDVTYLKKPAGAYYLDVSSTNAKWEVLIEEERDVPVAPAAPPADKATVTEKTEAALPPPPPPPPNPKPQAAKTTKGTITQDASLRAQPSRSADLLQIVPAGTAITIGRRENNYYAVELPGGTKGWAIAGTVEKNE